VASNFRIRFTVGRMTLGPLLANKTPDLGCVWLKGHRRRDRNNQVIGNIRKAKPAMLWRAS
jgi:hypothetical protein